MMAHILCSASFLLKLCRLGGNVEKYCTARQITYDNMAQALYILYI